MAKFLVDTNEFLDELRLSKKDIENYLATIVKEVKNIIFNEQIIDEFFRNIDKVVTTYKEYIHKRVVFLDTDAMEMITGPNTTGNSLI